MQIPKITAKHFVIAVAALAFVGCGVWYLLRFSSAPQNALVEPTYMPSLGVEPTAEPSPAPSYIKVHVTGYVNAPGMVTVPAGSRVAAAIYAAGGISEEGDDSSVNKADWLVDGQQIIVNNQPMPLTPTATGGAASALLNFNTATANELQQLHGVGAAIAGNVIAYRDRNGPFLSIEQVLNVSGISQRMLDSWEGLVTVE